MNDEVLKLAHILRDNFCGYLDSLLFDYLVVLWPKSGGCRMWPYYYEVRQRSTALLNFHISEAKLQKTLGTGN